MGSKLSSGAAKLGKKAAQSEAGRSAGKAAIKGAAEGAQKDLSDRYLRQGEREPTPEPPKPKEPVKQETSHSHTNTSSTVSHSSYTPSHDTQRHPRPPKPSVLARFKPVINVKKTTKSDHVKRRVPSHERVYSHRVAKTADWDRLLMGQALYNFKGEMPCDLEFRKGQVIQIVTRTENQFDWWEGKIEDHVGIFPANYVKLL